MIIVTGAAGFVGSNNVKALNDQGLTDIIAVDNLTKADKFRNLTDCEIADYLDKRDFLELVRSGACQGRSRVSSGRLLRHDGNRRPLHAGQQLSLFDGPAALVPG